MTGALKGRDMEMENTQREDMTGMVGQENMAETAGQDMTETAGQEEEIQLPQKKGRKERKQKRTRRRGSGRGLRAILRFVQHAALAAMVFSIIAITVSTTVQISGSRAQNRLSFTVYPDPGTSFEESETFNRLFGFALADIVRMGVVSSQLETEGVFDGGRLVDVTAYNHRDSVAPEQYVTAVYKLEDLLKWQNHGFTFSTIQEDEKAADFLSGGTRMTIIGGRSTDKEIEADKVRNAEIVVEYTEYADDSGFVEDYQPIGDLENHAGTAAADENVLTGDENTAAGAEDAEEVTKYEYEVLVNRYKTAEGKNLEEYASNWKEYYELVHNVQQAAESLAYNYNEYVEYNDYYSTENSNLRYMIVMHAGEDVKYYSNMDKGSPYWKKVMQIMTDLYEKGDETKLPHEKFIYYNAADMTFMTNTNIKGETLRQILQEYDYAYPEDFRIWVNVDASYSARDGFAQAKEYLPNLWLWVATAIILGLLYLFLFVYQTVVTGKEYDEEGVKQIRLNGFDRIPTEGALLIAFGAALMAVWILVVVNEVVGCDPTDIEYYRVAMNEDWFIVSLTVIVFAADMLFTFFFYSLVRRIKAGMLIKNSYLYRLLLRLKRFVWKVYDNSGIVLRTWVPYCVFLAFNLFVLLLALETGNLLLVLFAGAIDIVVGILLYKDAGERQGIVKGIETIAGGEVEHQIDTEELHGDNKVLANSVNSIGKGIKEAVEISMKDERMKADLITNVSHDIKTPLTSIINYVDLLKREQVDNEKVQNYIRVLDEKSQRLKQLTDDLVEASKITSGNISFDFERINMTELLNQTIGEFSEKFEKKNLTTVMNVNVRDAVIEADSRRIWRVMENLFNNVFKYAMPGTRVYVSMGKPEKGAPQEEDQIEISIKNISENPLNCRPEELTERFIRGDESRTTEGSGLGLSIAKNLTIAQKGSFEIALDGDLFKVFLTFPVAK